MFNPPPSVDVVKKTMNNKTTQKTILDFFQPKPVEEEEIDSELEKYYAYMAGRNTSIIVPTVANVRKRFGYKAINEYRSLLERAENSGVNFAVDDLIKLNGNCMMSRINKLRERLDDF